MTLRCKKGMTFRRESLKSLEEATLRLPYMSVAECRAASGRPTRTNSFSLHFVNHLPHFADNLQNLLFLKKTAFPAKGKTRVVSLYSVLHAYTLLFMTSNHTLLKQSLCADFICTGDSLRFALLPQYTEPIEPFSIHLSKSFLKSRAGRLLKPPHLCQSFAQISLCASAPALP